MAVCTAMMQHADCRFPPPHSCMLAIGLLTAHVFPYSHRSSQLWLHVLHMLHLHAQTVLQFHAILCYMAASHIKHMRALESSVLRGGRKI